MSFEYLSDSLYTPPLTKGCPIFTELMREPCSYFQLSAVWRFEKTDWSCRQM